LHKIVIQTPPGLSTETTIVSGRVAADSRTSVTIPIKAARDMAEGVYSVVFDVALDGRRHGPLFDMIVHVSTKEPVRGPIAKPKSGDDKAY